MKKKILFLGMMLVLALVCLTGCQPFTATIEVDKSGDAELISATGYFEDSFFEDWSYANKDVSDDLFPSWYDNYAPWTDCYIWSPDGDWEKKTHLVTLAEADLLVYDRMRSDGVYEIAVHNGLYDFSNLSSRLSEFDCDFTVLSDGVYGIDKVVMGNSTYEVGSKYVTYKGEGSWNIDVAGIVRENWNYVTSNVGDIAITSMLIYFEKDASLSPRNYSSFVDVPDSAWYAEAVNTLYWNEIVNGVGNGKFAPNSYLTIDQVCKLLTNIVALDVPSYDQSYWAYSHVKFALDNHWITNKGEITAANYGVPMTRAEAFTAFAMAFGIGSDPVTWQIQTWPTNVGVAEWTGMIPTTGALADGSIKFTSFGRSWRENTALWDAVSAEYEKAVSYDFMLSHSTNALKLYERGVINGGSNGELMPMKNLTRGEFCQMVYNMMYYDTESAAEANNGYATHESMIAHWVHAHDMDTKLRIGGGSRLTKWHDDRSFGYYNPLK